MPGPGPIAVLERNARLGGLAAGILPRTYPLCPGPQGIAATRPTWAAADGHAATESVDDGAGDQADPFHSSAVPATIETLPLGD